MNIPFRPVPRDWPGHSMPASVPHGMRVELSRAKIVPGREALAGQWMATLNARRDEAASGLRAEGIAVEASFFHREADGSLWLYHFTLGAAAPPVVGEPGIDPIGELHRDFNRRVKMRGWEELEPRLLLVPDGLREATGEWLGLVAREPGTK